MTRCWLAGLGVVAACGGGGGGQDGPQADAPGGPDAAVDAMPPDAAEGLTITIVGNPGQVELKDMDGFAFASCAASSCTIPLTPGAVVNVTTVSPGAAGQLTGVCTGTGTCSFTAVAGAQALTATFPLDAAAGEEWTVIAPATVVTLDMDGSGNVIAGGTAVVKLALDGSVVWTLPLAVEDLATGPGDTIYVHAGTDVVKLDASNATVWTRAIPASSQGGCHVTEFRHCIAVGTDGAVAIRGDTSVTWWDTDGNNSWTQAVATYAINTVAINGTGEVYATIEGPSAEPQDAVRFAADGTPLALVVSFCNQYHGEITTNAFTGAAVCTSSGHSNVYASGLGSVSIPDPDFVPTGMTGSATGDLGWLFYRTDDPEFRWQLSRYTAGGAVVWTQTGGVTEDVDTTEYVGTVPLDLAGGAGGRLAVVGELHGFGGSVVSYVTSYAP